MDPGGTADDNATMLTGPEAIPLPEPGGSGRFTLRLVGDADAVAWVEANLRGPGLGVDTGPCQEPRETDPKPGPIVWVARPGEAGQGRTVVDDAAVWSFPCLVVVPPGAPAPDILAGHPSVESFEVVREPEDAPDLRMRHERLLLLHRRRAQTEAVVHDLPVIVYSRTLDGVLTSVNAEAENFLGRPRSAAVGRPLLEVLPAGLFGQPEIDATNEALLARGHHRKRIVGTHPQGKRIALDTRVLLLRDGHGTPWGAQVVMADLTDELETQERLRVEAERSEILAAIATATRDVTDLDRVLAVAVSVVGRRSAARTAALFLPDETGGAFVLRHSWRAVDGLADPVGAGWLTRETTAFRTVVTERAPWIVPDAETAEMPPGAARALRSFGSRSGILLPVVVETETVAVLGLSFPDPRAFPPDEIAFLSLVADQLALAIHAARLYRSLAEKLRALAEEQRLRELATQDRQRLLSMLVHDLKNPLAAVLASLELGLERTAGDQRLERLLRTSMASARALSGMIDDALLVYRSGEAPADRRPEDVPAVLAQPFEEARWMATARNIRLEIEVAECLPRVSLDAGRYRRAAANLLSNALKFTRRGEDVAVRVALEEARGDTWLVLRVADSGPGVPEAVRHRLAEPYQRFAGSERVPGTGLGLTVVGAVAADHGGCVEVEPRPAPGRGSVFSLWVPA